MTSSIGAVLKPMASVLLYLFVLHTIPVNPASVRLPGLFSTDLSTFVYTWPYKELQISQFAELPHIALPSRICNSVYWFGFFAYIVSSYCTTPESYFLSGT
ncbi:hypothetical protein L211DRAFT_267957 [Terfezia boudieri ATCC MYA-4762]|uniref:GPI mannosyltransferase 2 n=1 Tax=Terfezia boudieri ATCC MYA-4762 TaxID=1051890 RepID=A0A3N4LKY3_9PEZI|nr:hypothetical protein L211DRAFT_267957 [Terfezia boudieri ATCC MYA-4762]